MLFLLSPAKTLDETTTPPFRGNSSPRLLEHSAELVEILKRYSSEDIQALMKVSEKIADLNVERFHNYETPFTHENAKEALFLFKGDVYEGIDAYTLSEKEMTYLNDHLLMLSGLYGAVKPLDLIFPYRLEMGTRLKNDRGTNLYQFWGDRVTNRLNEAIEEQGHKAVINLASNEYFKAVQPRALNAPVITPVFQDFSKGTFKVISFYAKKARGLMTRFAAETNAKTVDDLKAFNTDGYEFIEMNGKNEMLFQRKLGA